MSTKVLLEQKDGVIYVTLNRPEAYNSLDVPMLEELLGKLQEASKMEEKILVLKGSGKGFSAGGDIKSMLASFDTPFESIMKIIGGVVSALYEMPKLTISAIHGAAAGLGLSIALACDYVVADSSSKVAMNFIGIGLVPDGAGHFFLQKRLGDVRAKEVIWEGKTLSANEGLKYGLVDVVADNLEEAIANKVSEWKQKPVLAMIATKAIYVQQSLPSLHKTLEIEMKYQGEMRATRDHKEGVTAFIEKRLPNYIGK
ncbi:enoyl-CoA hydratase [Bacillus suaedaesalsae]|uniref:enoyl-CoA hydratase n=1 Tax=Bacillus suaedaesalsae TaxID=2810349 RepID=UPI001EF3E9EC|nr:enoyl-CoA hydratase [Bacillus suaedaesalsae]